MDDGQVDDLVSMIASVADAITPNDFAPRRDATGGIVSSLTEAVMGMTAVLCRIEEAIQELAEAVKDTR